MFNLIIAVVAIVLVAVLGLAGIWYGGETISTQTHKTDFAQMVNASTQIKGAMEMYRSRNGFYPVGVADEGAGTTETDDILNQLNGDYLSSIPDGSWNIGEGHIKQPLTDEDACSRFNKLSGLEEICPPCDDAGTYNYPACEATP